MKLQTYEVRMGSSWQKVKGLPLGNGWLTWKMRDGTNGLSRPVNWRIPVKTAKAKTL